MSPDQARRYRVAGIVALVNGCALIAGAAAIGFPPGLGRISPLLLVGGQAMLIGGIGIALSLPPERQLSNWHPGAIRLAAWWSVIVTAAFVVLGERMPGMLRAIRPALPPPLDEVVYLALVIVVGGGFYIVFMGAWVVVIYLVIDGVSACSRFAPCRRSSRSAPPSTHQSARSGCLSDAPGVKSGGEQRASARGDASACSAASARSSAAR